MSESIDCRLKYVVHKHHARSLHYDFRLEHKGVLKSWAVPKGPPLKKGVKRLAVLVEDHTLEYGDFEGVIPEGQYGAGKVEIWDKGTYCSYKTETKRESEKAFEEGFEKGELKVVINGDKLNGKYLLIRLKGQGKNWLLFKA